MNHKRKHRKPAYRLMKSKELESRKPAHWEYGAAIAKEVCLRVEFKREKYLILKSGKFE